jgi:putative DNA primase/helicase
MRCGKTLLLIVLGALTPRRVFASNITPAGLFRTIEKFQPTLFIDEADTFLRDNDDLRGLLNCGTTRTTAVIIRPVGDDHEPRAFSTWCAKVVALIGKLPPRC